MIANAVVKVYHVDVQAHSEEPMEFMFDVCSINVKRQTAGAHTKRNSNRKMMVSRFRLSPLASWKHVVTTGAQADIEQETKQPKGEGDFLVDTRRFDLANERSRQGHYFSF